MSKKFVFVEGVTKKHEILKEAMKHLAKDSDEMKKEGKHEFICHAVGQVINPHKPWDVSCAVTEVIRDRLFPSGTLEQWLYSTGWASDEELSNDCHLNEARKLQYTRKCWMQSMYEEFKALDQ